MLLFAVLLVRYSPFPRRFAVPGMLAVAVLARLLLLPMDVSGDVYRYAWEGLVQAHGVNPYVTPPGDAALAPLRTTWWGLINHPDKTAIYPPGMLLLLRGFTALTAEPAHMKWLFVVFDVAALGVLLSILRAAGRRVEWAWLYAVNPVVLLSFAGEAHLDSAMVFFALLALYLHQTRRWRLLFLAAGLAFQAKYMALLLCPFLVRRDNLRYAPWWLLSAGVPFLFYTPLSDTFTTLWRFGAEMRFHGSVHVVLTLMFGDTRVATLVAAGCFALYVVALRLAVVSPLESLPYAWAGLLAFLPTVHFWYLTWLIPFLCLRPIRGWLLFCGTIVFSFATIAGEHRLGEWVEHTWALLAMYLPVYALLLFDLARGRPVAAVAEDARLPVRDIGVVVPTLDEGGDLPCLLEDLRRQTLTPARIVVSDGGSTDATPAIARAAGATLVTAPKGRGLQIREGVRHLDTDAVLIAHADMRLPADLIERIRDALNDTGRIGGAAGSRFDVRTPFLCGIELMNMARARWLGISFGDQGQFVRMDVLAGIGGFPAIPLMEDVEFSLRVRGVERPLYLRAGIRASARRWRGSHPLRHAALVMRLTGRYLRLRIRAAGALPDTTDFYDAYHARPAGPRPE